MIEIEGKLYKELRCNRCQSFVTYINNLSGEVDVFFHCPKCGHTNSWHFISLKRWYKQDKLKKESAIISPDSKISEGGEN